MHHEGLSTAHKLLHMALDNWQYTLAVIGGVLGSVWWALHLVFTTHEVMNQCKSSLEATLKRQEEEAIERQDKSDTENAKQHHDIKVDINRLTDHLLGNGK